MKRYTKILLCLAVLFLGGEILPPEADMDFHAGPDNSSAILSGPIVPTCLAICEPTHCRSRISSGLMPAGWFDKGLKNNRYETAFNGFFSHQQCTIMSETTLFSFDCMLQI